MYEVNITLEEKIHDEKGFRRAIVKRCNVTECGYLSQAENIFDEVRKNNAIGSSLEYFIKTIINNELKGLEND